jgi:predicted nucleic acid-binding protein
MPAPTCYLETSVWGSLARGQPRDRKQVVLRLLHLLDGVHGTCVVSDVVLAEIQNAARGDLAQIQDRLKATDHTVYPVNADMESLARA